MPPHLVRLHEQPDGIWVVQLTRPRRVLAGASRGHAVARALREVGRAEGGGVKFIEVPRRRSEVT